MWHCQLLHFQTPSVVWEGLTHISPGLLSLATERSQVGVLSRSHRDGCRRELKQGIWPLRGEVFGAWSLPLGEARMQLSLTQHLTSSQGSFSEDPRERSKTSHDWVLDIMWQYFHYVLFAVKPRNCRSIHPFLEASPRGLRAVTYRRSGSSLCRLAALKSSSHARIGEEVFQ